MICENHERQLSFFARGCGKIGKNVKNSALTLRGMACLSKSALFSLIETLCNNRDNQMLSQSACLYFMMQLQKVIGHTHKIPFHHDIGIPPRQKTPKVHVLFNHGKNAFRLNGAVDSEQNSFLCGNLLLHGFPLLDEVFGHMQPLYSFFKGCLVRFLLPDALILHRTILAASAFIYRYILDIACFRLPLFHSHCL